MNVNFEATVDQSDRKVPINLRQSGPTPTELLISTRVRKSPYWHLSHEAGAGGQRCTIGSTIRGVMSGPGDGGAMVEYDALVNRVTLWNVAVERQIRVAGPDAEAFVDHVITRSARRIAPMHGKYVILCNEQGGILNDPVLLRLSEDEFWFSLSGLGHHVLAPGRERGSSHGCGDRRDRRVARYRSRAPLSEALMKDLVGSEVSTLPSLRVDGGANSWL